MNLQFDTLTISNFKSFVGKPQVLRLNQPGLHFIRGLNKVERRLGSNGAGKSSLWDAIAWCLYGRTINGLRNPDIAPWGSKDRTDVMIGVSINDQPFTISRLTHPNQLVINDDMVGQEAVVDLIGMDYDVFVNTVVLGQGRPLFLDRTPSDKLQLFVDVLDLERWEHRSKAADDRTQEMLQKAGVVQDKLVANKSAMATYAEQLKQAKQRSQQWLAEQADRQTTYDKAAEGLQEDYEAKQSNLDRADLLYDGAMTELKALEEQRKQLQTYLRLAQDERDEHMVGVRAYIAEVGRLERELKTLGKSDKCPTCGQSIKGTQLARHKNELQKKIKLAQTNAATAVPKAITSSIEDLLKQLQDNSDHLHIFQTKAEQTRAEYDRYLPLAAVAKATLQAMQTSKTEHFEARNPYHEQIQSIRRQQKKRLVRQRKLTKRAKLLNRRAERARFWIGGFKDVRLYIIEEVLEELELTTNTILADVGLEDWQVRYAVERETKSGTKQRGVNATILSPHNTEPVNWHSWSGGEGQRLRLVSTLALSEVLLSRAGVQTNMEILDEPTQWLSAEGANDLVELLADRAKRRTIWYCDHISRESTRFASTLTVIKGENGSRA